ncbi:MAG: Uma2 family endonuclease [Acidobacteria bacterium]|nr:Uma2 family endonuclease [Acidobacteriota bacterium]
MNAVFVDFMAAIETLPPETPLTMTDVSWDEYVRIADEIGERPGVRVTYDQGRLEIMTLSPEHEGPSRLFTHLISVIVEEIGADYISLGSTTLRLQVIEGGLEADDCYYIGDFAAVAGKKRLDLKVDPPPDLAVEVDISHGSRSKFRIYAGLKVKELWRCDGKKVEFYRLSGDHYVEIDSSDLFSFLRPDVLPDFLEQGLNEGIVAMRRAFRDWVKANCN